MIEKLTPKNQTRAIVDDIENYATRPGRPHYSIYHHLLVISRRLDAVEASLSAGEKDHG